MSAEDRAAIERYLLQTARLTTNSASVELRALRSELRVLLVAPGLLAALALGLALGKVPLDRRR